MEQPVGRLVVVDDEPNICRVLAALFERAGYKVVTYNHAGKALNAILEDPEFDAIITDLMMPEVSGIDLLKSLRERGMDQPVLMITAHGNVDTAVEAMKVGAFDYVSKPFDAEEVRLKIERAIRQYSLQKENEFLRNELKARYKFDNIIGPSPAMQEVYNLIAKAARSKANVLIRGESGTGKELVAKALHYNSPRAKGKFIAVSCAALPSELLESELFGHEKGAFTGALWQKAGRFELADNGTLFLDEIGDISASVQIKLLRVLQEKEFERVGGVKPLKVDVRLVAASNRNLEEAVQRGEFREDLYYRLRVVQITIPPLRDRREDVPFLVEFFLKKYGNQDGRKIRTVEPVAMELMQKYDWPGNVRELENAMHRAVLLAVGPEIDVDAIRLPDGQPLSAGAHGAAVDAGFAGRAAQVADTVTRAHVGQTVAQMEKTLILDTLSHCLGNRTHAATILGISIRTLRNKLNEYADEGTSIPAPQSGIAAGGYAAA